MGTSREALSKGIAWAQARLQMQIGHAGATRRTFIFLAAGIVTDAMLGLNEKGLWLHWSRCRFEARCIGQARCIGSGWMQLTVFVAAMAILFWSEAMLVRFKCAPEAHYVLVSFSPTVVAHLIMAI